MSTKRYTDEFKIEAVRQIVEYGRPVAEVAERLGVSVHSLYGWRRQHGQGEVGRRVEQDQNAEVRRLKAELRRVTEERDILKKAAVSSTRQCNMINSCTDRSERYGKDGAARHVSSPEARSMATMEGRPVAQRHCPLL